MGSVNPATSDSQSATKSFKSMTGKSIFTVPNQFIKEDSQGFVSVKPDNNDDFIKSLQPDAVRLQARSVTEDGVKIPLNFQFVEQIRRKNPERLFEPVDVARPRERIVTVGEFDKQLKTLERAERKRDNIYKDVVEEITQKTKNYGIEWGDTTKSIDILPEPANTPRGRPKKPRIAISHSDGNTHLEKRFIGTEEVSIRDFDKDLQQKQNAIKRKQSVKDEYSLIRDAENATQAYRDNRGNSKRKNSKGKKNK